MPSDPEKQRDKTSGDMAPFIIFMAFVILTTVIVISIYKMKSENDELDAQKNSGFTVTLNASDPLVFADDFLFPGFFPVSGEAEQSSRPNIQQDIIEVRRMMAAGDRKHAEDRLRTLFLFYPDDIEINHLLSELLRASGRAEEANYYDERLSFLRVSPMPDTIPSAPPEQEKRVGP